MSVKIPRAPSMGEETLQLHLRAAKLTGWQREYLFAQPRLWRFDFAHPGCMLAVEVEGGIHTNGRHTRGSGYKADLEKYNQAALLGWRVLRFDTDDVLNGSAIRVIKDAISLLQFMERQLGEGC